MGATDSNRLRVLLLTTKCSRPSAHDCTQKTHVIPFGCTLGAGSGCTPDAHARRVIRGPAPPSDPNHNPTYTGGSVMARPQKLPSGLWRVQIRRGDTYRAATFDKKSQAREWPAQIEAQVQQIQRGGLIDSKGLKVGHLVEMYPRGYPRRWAHQRGMPSASGGSLDRPFIWTPLGLQDDLRFGVKDRLRAYVRPSSAGLQHWGPGPDGNPLASTSSENRSCETRPVIRFLRRRSDLSCHHGVISAIGSEYSCLS
jgi:hypothetical protein